MHLIKQEIHTDWFCLVGSEADGQQTTGETHGVGQTLVFILINLHHHHHPHPPVDPCSTTRSGLKEDPSPSPGHLVVLSKKSSTTNVDSCLALTGPKLGT
jgi:hypothetical protein